MKAVFHILDDAMCISVEGCAMAMDNALDKAMNVIWKGIKRSKIYNRSSYKTIQDPQDLRRSWLIITTLPTRVQGLIQNHYGDPYLYYMYERCIYDINMSIEEADSLYYISQGIQESKVIQLQRSCAWMRLIAADKYSDLYPGVQRRYEMLIQVIGKDSGHTLHNISNWRILRRKVVAWKKDGRSSLISRLSGNSNSRKLQDTGIAFIVNSYASPLKPSVRDVYRLYTERAIKQGWALITEERVRQIITDEAHQQLIAQSRHGHNYTSNRYERTIKRKTPTFPDALWTLDGFTVQLRYTDNGKICSDLYIVAVMDVYSRRIVGYATGTAETSVLVQKSIRQAIRNSMKMPLQLQYDNSSANKSKEVTELMQRIARWAFPTAPYNGKSKPIEAVIGYIEGHNMRHMPNFKGGNITSHSIDIKANPEFLIDQKLPDIQTVIAQVHLIIETYNNTTGKLSGGTPVELYDTPHPLRRDMDYLAMIQAFWVTRRETARYTKDGLTIQVDKQRYTYEVETSRGVEDMEFRLKWIGTDFTIKYDPDDLEYISLWYEGKHISEAHIKWEAPMAIVDMEPGDRARIDSALAARKQYRQVLKDKLQTYKATVADAGLETELSHYILHKDAYNKLESKLQDDDIDMRALHMAGYPEHLKRKNKVTLYGNEEGSMKIIE